MSTPPIPPAPEHWQPGQPGQPSPVAQPGQAAQPGQWGAQPGWQQQPQAQYVQPQQPPTTTTRSSRHVLALISGFGGAGMLMLAQILPYDGTIALLSMTAWSLFAVLSGGVTAVGVLLTKPGTTGGLRLLAQGGAAAVGIYWVLIVVRSVPSNDSFVATVGAFLSIGSVWLTSQDSR